MKIAILDDYQDAVRHLECFKSLADHEVKIFTNTVKGVGQLVVRLREAEALVLIRDRTRISAALLEKLPNLKVIAQTGGVDRGPEGHIDLAACAKRGVTVIEGVDDPVAPAELTWALIMAAQRRLPQYIQRLIHGAWQQSGLKSATMPVNHGIGQSLHGKTLAIWGFGNVGRLVAGYGRAFGMKVMIWGSEASRESALQAGFAVASSREALFAQADVLSLHLRLADTTRNLIKRDDFARMKSSALFVNTSNAEIVEHDALVRALNQGRPGLAALDVYESEPILQGSPLLRLENTICTPHLGYVEKDNYARLFGDAFRNLLMFADANSSTPATTL